MNELKLIIAGGRGFNDYGLLVSAMVLMPENLPEYGVLSVVSGKARGADALGERFARENGLRIYAYPAQWDIHGKSAGYKRNVAMAKEADALLSFWDGKSVGTKHMIDTMDRLGKPAFIVHY